MTVAAPQETDSKRATLESALEAARLTEIPSPLACLGVARAYVELDEAKEAIKWCAQVVKSGLDYRSWDAAGRILKRLYPEFAPIARRSARLAVIGSYTTDQLVDLLRLAAAERGVHLDIYESGYGQYQQEILNKESGLYAHDPELVVLAVHEGDLELPDYSPSPDETVKQEVVRWEGLWARITDNTNATVIHTSFVKRPEDPFGHLSSKLAGSRSSMVAAVNSQLGDLAPKEVAILDCERLAANLGKGRWFDDRYWHRSKQAVAFDALPTMARDISAMIGAQLGMTRKCLVLDLDGTLWGGIIGEDGMDGIRIGHGFDGEAFAAFQEYVLSLKDRGVVLAVCSKNDEATARKPFESHPDMRLSLNDIATFQANWRPKPENIRRIAESLGLGLDAMVFVDDQPAEREVVRQALEMVDVIVLPEDPSRYVETLARYPHFESASYTDEDNRRTESYRARNQAFEARDKADSLDDFLRSLDMRATIQPFDDFHLARIVQLIGKTNQFNLTTRRHNQAAVQEIIERPESIHLYLKLRDRFADHGLVGIVMGTNEGQVLEIDTLLMSCRVIGRTVEVALVGELAARARDLGYKSLRGVYRPTDRNGLVAGLYESLGFQLESETAEETVWSYELDKNPIDSQFVTTEVS